MSTACDTGFCHAVRQAFPTVSASHLLNHASPPTAHPLREFDESHGTPFRSHRRGNRPPHFENTHTVPNHYGILEQAARPGPVVPVPAACPIPRPLTNWVYRILVG